MFARRGNRQAQSNNGNRKSTQRQAKRRFGPRLEPLEDRRLLTAGYTNYSAGQTLINLDDFVTAFPNIDGGGSSIVFIDAGFDELNDAFGPDANSNGVSDRITYKYDFADDDSTVTPAGAWGANIQDHGTRTASIAAGTSFSGFDGGIARAANLIFLKVAPNSSGSGEIDYMAVQEALRWTIDNVAEHNIVAVNMSFGVSDGWGTTSSDAPGESAWAFYPSSLSDITDELVDLASRDVIISAGAGNGFTSLDGTANAEDILAPAAYNSTIAVGAVFDTTGTHANLSEFGLPDVDTYASDRVAPFSQRNDGLYSGAVYNQFRTVMAPGVFTNSARSTGSPNAASGTSFSSPVVAGLAAMMQDLAQSEIGRRLTLNEFREILNSTGASITDSEVADDVTNTGLTFKRVDALAFGNQLDTLGSTNNLPVAIGDTVIVRGRTTADDIDLAPASTGGGNHVLTLNGTNYNYAAATYKHFVIEARDGADTFDVTNTNTTPSSITFFGGAGNDTATGSAIPDRLVGGDGDDSLDGGSDYSPQVGSGTWVPNILEGGTGNDTLIGGDWGNLYLFAATGATNLGTDSVTEGGSGELYGNADSLDFRNFHGAVGTSGTAFNLATTGNQTVASGKLVLNLSSSTGIENVLGSRFDDYVVGNGQNNRLYGGDGSDDLDGQGGTDYLDGYRGNDTIRGGADFDGFFFYGSAGLNLGTDTLFDSAGTGDSLVFTHWSHRVTIDLSNTTGYQFVDNADGTLRLALKLDGATIENVSGSGLDDIIVGNSSVNVLSGGAGNDIILAGSNDDFLLGEDGNDSLYGEAGNDNLVGGDGNDTYYFSGSSALGSDSIIESSGTDTVDLSGLGRRVWFRADIDTAQTVDYWWSSDGHGSSILSIDLDGTAVIENIVGTAYSDVLYGNSLANTISAGVGFDIVHGWGGNDTINGGDGVDNLYGDDGNDTINGDAAGDAIWGGAGDDTLSGGAGDDIYLFDSVDGDLGWDTLNESASNGTDLLDFSNFERRIQLNLSNTAKQRLDLDTAGWYLGLSSLLELTLSANNTFENVKVPAVSQSNVGSVIYGNTQNNTIWGSIGDDYLYGFGGNDTLYGSTRNDQLFGGTGSDTIYGEAGLDSIYANDGVIGDDVVDTLYANSNSTDSTTVNDGTDYLFAEAIDTIFRKTSASDNDQLTVEP